MEYVPFLKLKQNELGALYVLNDECNESILPLLDIPRSQNMDEIDFIHKISTSNKQLKRYFKQDRPFYLDVFDINPLLRPSGLHPYEYALIELNDFNIYPIVGLDRDIEHINSAEGYISTDDNPKNMHVGIRLLQEDIEHYAISRQGINDLYQIFNQYTDNIDIIIDVRNVYNEDVSAIAEQAIEFSKQLKSEFAIKDIIFTCCSIPSSISDVVRTENSAVTQRAEYLFFNSVKSNVPDAIYGDYTVVSPEYTEIPVELFSKVSAPKIIYTCADEYFIVRGGAFRTHALKYRQYYNLAQSVYDYAEFRGKGFSFGEDYIAEKKDGTGSTGSPGSWLKAMINSHITFILALGF